jgi:hypothetical protein
MDNEAWNSHKWSNDRWRQIEIEPSRPLTQHRCSQCRRDFVEDTSTGDRYAVYVSAFSFRRLPNPISEQWLREPCPGGPLPHDIEVRGKLIENRGIQIAPIASHA